MSGNRLPLPSAAEIATLPPDGGPEFNRLIFSASPYLLQHARNPVDWYPWCEEAFERARRENKPVLLSVGYSTCYWCHVMERECFEKQDVADILNTEYICIKVDREERPDIDSIYITAAQLMIGRAGWPNNVWLTAEKKPWYAATYVPKEDGPWGEGFISLSRRLAEKYRNERQSVEDMASELAAQIERLSLFQAAAAETDLSRERSRELLRQLSFAYDSLRGGVGLQPKFPPHGALSFWSYEYMKTEDEKILAKIVKTQDAIVSGGLRDHVGGGFHRYCTDQRWTLPHFEKMLYDNAQLARTLCDAWLITGKAEYRRAAEEALNWALTEMRDPDGGFFSAVDAESNGEEGLYYTYTYQEARNAVGPEDADWFSSVFNLAQEGNYLEEHTGQMTGRNVLYRSMTLEALAQAEDRPEAEVQARLDRCFERLRQLRQHRDRPHVDDKVLTSWNALMVGALAYCGRHFANEKYLAEAARCAGFLLNKATTPEGRLCQSWRHGQPYGEAYLDSYAYLARALVDLYQSSADPRWLAEAEELTNTGMAEFRDTASGGYYFARPGSEELIASSKSALDDVTPSGNGVAAQVLVRLHNITGKAEYDKLARSTIAAFSGQMAEAPLSTQSMYLALNMLADGSVSDGRVEGAAGLSATLSPPDAASRQAPVTLELYIARKVVRAGSVVRAKLRIGLDQGFHVNSASPLHDFLLPTAVEPGQGSELVLRDVEYPKGVPLTTSLGQGVQSVYKDGTWIELEFEVPQRVGARCRGVLQVNVQPCDDKACQLPQVHVLEVGVDVGNEDGPPQHSDVFAEHGVSGDSGGPAGLRAELTICGAAILLALLTALLTRRRRPKP